MIIKNLLADKKFWLISALLWTGIIFYLCLVDSSELPSLSITKNNFDKLIHFLFHFIFTALWGFYSYIPFKIIHKKTIIAIVILSITIGIVIEILQAFFTTSRHADILDVLANTFGAIASGLLLYSILKTKKELKNL